MIQPPNTSKSILALLIFIGCVDLDKQQGLLCNSQAAPIAHFLLSNADLDESSITDKSFPT